jgi:cation diffusion facilitator CzcD-associated flavoprotein CzcO
LQGAYYTYAGVACDVPSHLYSYSFAPNPDWSHRFSPGAEILEYFERVAREYEVEKFIHYGMEVSRCEFDGTRWRIETACGARDEADFVIAATGVLHHPAYTDEEKQGFHADPAGLKASRDQMSQIFADGFSNAVVDAHSSQLKMIEEVCRENLENSVTNPELRERLRPNYRAACKRLIISQDFYQAIQHPNAELVTEEIDRIEAKGVRTKDGRLHELDVLVIATGFRVDRFLRPINVIGRGGITLEEAWAERPTAYLSISIPDFPNLFMLNGPNGPVGNFSLIEVAELQFGYIMQLVAQVRSGRFRQISASHAATRQFDEARVKAAKNTVWATGCRSWYLDDRGIPAVWPWTFDRFREDLAAPDISHFDLR